MNYTVHIDIARPLDEVVALFDDADNLYKWMDGLQKVEHVSGEPGEPGAKTKLFFKSSKREIEMLETIQSRNLPQEMTMSFEAGGVYNINTNRFEALPNGGTRYYSDQEFQFKGFMMKLMGALMPGAFKKESMKFMTAFKDFAESQENTINA